MADEFDQFKRPQAAGNAGAQSGDEFAKYKRAPAPAAAPASDWEDLKSFGSRLGQDALDAGKSIGSGIEDVYESHDPLTEIKNKGVKMGSDVMQGTYNALDRAEQSGGEAWKAVKRGDYGTALDQALATGQHEAGMLPFVDPVDRGYERMIAEKHATGRVNPETAADTTASGLMTATPEATRLIPKFVRGAAPVVRAAGKAVGDVATPENLATAAGGYIGHHFGGPFAGGGGALAGKALGRAFARRLGEGSPEAIPAAEEAGIPDATSPAEPVRGLLKAAPTELGASEAPIGAEPEGLLDANRRVVRDPATGRMKVQYLTSSGGKVVRESPVAPTEGIAEASAATSEEAPPVPKGGIRGVKPPTGYTVDTPGEEPTIDMLMRGGTPDNPIDQAIGEAANKSGGTKLQAEDNTSQRILDNKALKADMAPKGRPGETEAGIPETNGAISETPAPRKGPRGIQIPLAEWQAGQEIPTNVENTRIPRPTLLKQPNGGSEPLGANEDLTGPLQRSIPKFKAPKLRVSGEDQPISELEEKPEFAFA